jgi:hypothetical protein
MKYNMDLLDSENEKKDILIRFELILIFTCLREDIHIKAYANNDSACVEYYFEMRILFLTNSIR